MDNIENLLTLLSKYQDRIEIIANNEMSKLRNNTEKKIKNLENRLNAINEVSIAFKENISEDSNVMDKYSQNIYESIQDMVTKTEIPSIINLKNINQYLDNIRTSLIELDKILIKYIKLLKDRKYGKRVKSLDKSYKRFLKDLLSIENFVKNDYAPSAKVETISINIQETIELFPKYEQIFYNLNQHKDEVNLKQLELKNLNEELAQLVNHPTKLNYDKILIEYQNMQRELDHKFSNIRKVLRKYQKFVIKNKLNTDKKLISDLITDVGSTIGIQLNLSSLNNLLSDISKVIDDPSFNLSRDKRNIVSAEINELLDHKLNDYYKNAKEIINSKNELETKLYTLELENKITTINQHIIAINRDAERIYSREYRSLLDVEANIRKNISEIENEIRETLRENIILELKFKTHPNWLIND